MAADDLDKPGREFPGQLKGFFAELAGRRAPASEHLTHGARESEQLAELIGQMQHLITLLENTFGRPAYAPILATLNGATSVDVTQGLPTGHAQIDNFVISTDTAVATVTVTLYAPSILTGSRVIYQGSLPTGMPPAIPINTDLPPDTTRINITLSAPPTHAYAQFLCSPVSPVQGGAYPYVR